VLGPFVPQLAASKWFELAGDGREELIAGVGVALLPFEQALAKWLGQVPSVAKLPFSIQDGKPVNPCPQSLHYQFMRKGGGKAAHEIWGHRLSCQIRKLPL
jgi:hypothetical protein